MKLDCEANHCSDPQSRSQTGAPAARQVVLLALLGLLLPAVSALAAIRDGGIDPANLGKGDWIYFMSMATNRLGGNVNSVTNEHSLMRWYTNQGIRYVIVKAATDDYLFNGSYSQPQFTSSLVNIAHQHGLLIFGYNRSYGRNVPGEIAISDYVFQQGADGFVWDAESEWESQQPWIGDNGPALAWELCSTVRSNWPTKFLAHAPFDIISYHASFPYKEFGFWCDAVLPQIYHFARTGIKSRPTGNINWADANWHNWQNALFSLPATNINGVTVHWTNAIKPLAPVNHVYGPNPPNTGVSEIPPSHVREFVDCLLSDPNTAPAGGYKGASFWRADLHGAAQWANIKAATIGDFPGIVNHIVIDSPDVTSAAGWTSVRTFSNGAFYGEGSGTDTNSFGTNYLTKGQGTGANCVEFTPNIRVAGDYDVYQWHPSVLNASTGTPFAITHTLGTTTVLANQRTNAGDWSWLGRFNFAAGTSGRIRVLDNFADAGSVAIADAIKLAFFATNPPGYPLALTVVGNGSITPNPNHPNYSPGTTVTLTAMPAPGNTFSGWSDDASGMNNPATVVMTAPRAVTATFANTNADIFLDNTNAEVNFVGSWSTGTTAAGRYLADYRFAPATAGGTATATYRPLIGVPGYYNVFLQYPQGSNRATNAPWVVQYQGGSVTVPVNQQTGGGSWLLLASARPFAAGTSGYVQLGNNAGPAGTVVLADGVRLSYVGPLEATPNITTQPQSQSVKPWVNVTFSVVATAVPAPGYQWRFNGTNLAGATGATYVRNTVQFADAGNYSVLVTNLAGGILSSNATLTLLPLLPMGFQSISPLSDGRMTLVVTGEPGYAYWVDRATNLADWQPLTNLVNAGGTSAFTDHSATNSAAGFYRARQ